MISSSEGVAQPSSQSSTSHTNHGLQGRESYPDLHTKDSRAQCADDTEDHGRYFYYNESLLGQLSNSEPAPQVTEDFAIDSPSRALWEECCMPFSERNEDVFNSIELVNNILPNDYHGASVSTGVEGAQLSNEASVFEHVPGNGPVQE